MGKDAIQQRRDYPKGGSSANKNKVRRSSRSPMGIKEFEASQSRSIKRGNAERERFLKGEKNIHIGKKRMSKGRTLREQPRKKDQKSSRGAPSEKKNKSRAEARRVGVDPGSGGGGGRQKHRPKRGSVHILKWKCKHSTPKQPERTFFQATCRKSKQGRRKKLAKLRLGTTPCEQHGSIKKTR